MAFNERAASGAASGATAVLYTALGSQVEIRKSSRVLQLLVRRWIFWRKMMKKLMQLRRWLLRRRIFWRKMLQLVRRWLLWMKKMMQLRRWLLYRRKKI